MDPEIKKQIVKEVIKLLEKNRLFPSEEKEVLIDTAAALDDEEFLAELWEEMQGEEKAREKWRIIGYLISVFLCVVVAAAMAITLFIRLIPMG